MVGFSRLRPALAGRRSARSWLPERGLLPARLQVLALPAQRVPLLRLDLVLARRSAVARLVLAWAPQPAREWVPREQEWEARLAQHLLACSAVCCRVVA
ncbi:hypothetical protein [Paraburkholderia bannensis]|uniref:hypothetical protein n=1 Tax=Paraburkholderia bannensis TaxID=765414 RepID=UPI002AB6A278|nr:hypothetical protein [Paraburkholderia bannensis]